jgi:hypothetical protein
MCLYGDVHSNVLCTSAPLPPGHTTAATASSHAKCPLGSAGRQLLLWRLSLL